jgi:hypothetical protein
VFPRIRDIIDGVGTRLRVSVDAFPAGALTVIEDPGAPATSRILLDPYGTELLGGYIMSARLALPFGLPDEFSEGAFAARFQLVCEPEPAIVITQSEGRSFIISAPFWDKLYAELCMVIAHTRRLRPERFARLQ